MLQNLGAKVFEITTVDRALWQLLEEVWYTVEHTFSGTPVLKMWENSKGVGIFKSIQFQLAAVPQQGQQ